MFDAHLTRQQRIRYYVRGPEWGFAIPQGDLAALEDVMQRCSAFWNGIGSLMIPVSRDGRIAPATARFLADTPIEMCWVHPSLGVRAREAVLRRFENTSGLHDDFDRDEQHPLFLLSRPADLGEAPSMLIPQFASEPLRRISLACWGQIREGEQQYWSSYFNAVRVDGDVATRAMIDAQWSPSGASPLRVSGSHMDAFARSNLNEWPYLFVFSRASFNELVLFWNVRARTPFGPAARVVGIPQTALRMPQLLKGLATWARILPGVSLTPDLYVVAPGTPGAQVATALQAVGFDEMRGGAHRFSFGPAVSPQGRPRYARVPSLRGGELVRGASSEALVTISKGRAMISLSPPEGVEHLRGITRLIVEGLPTPLPLTPSSARSVTSSGAASRSGGLLLHLVVMGVGRNWNLDLTIPTHDVALRAWASDRGFSVRATQDGRYAEALIGRLEKLDRLDVLADEHCLSILSNLASESRKKLVQRLAREFGPSPDSTGSQHFIDRLSERLRDEALFLELQAKDASALGASVGGKANAVRALGPLIEAGFVRRGFSTTCPECNTNFFVALDQLDETISCAACRREFVLPTSRSAQELPLRYRLDGLMARVMDQDVLPVLLTLRALRRPCRDPDVFFAWPGLEFSAGETKTDADLVVSCEHGIYCCEVKMSAGGLSDAQLEKLVVLSEQLKAKPAIAALEGAFGERQVEEVRERGGMVFERTELLAA